MPQDQTLIVFGATGDLCGRHLIPALARLFVADELPAGFRFVGTGPQQWDTPTFTEHVRARLTSFAPDLASAGTAAFLGRISYHPADVLDPVAVVGLVSRAPSNASLTFYLALPTHLIGAAVDALGQGNLPASARIAVEKPFGSDLATARNLNTALARATSDESRIFRVDHFLGMPPVQALPATVTRLRRASVAAGSDITKVSILWEETLALEGRAAFYDRAGALKDLLQNHLLQILCQVTTDASVATADSWSDRRLESLRAVQVPTAEQARTTTRRARYTAGTLAPDADGASRQVPDYVAEDGVDANRQTETFAEVSLRVDAGDWSNTEFVLRAGKAMGGVRRGVLLERRAEPGQAAVDDLWIDLEQPVPAASPPADPAIESAPTEQLAYINILRDLLSGSGGLSVTREETELAWRVFTPTLQQWTAGNVPLETYPAGSAPAEAEQGER